MKRYLVFQGSDYYPSGGWRDYSCDFDTLEQFENFINEIDPVEDYFKDWCHVYDSLENKIIKEYYSVGKKLVEDLNL